MKCMKDQKLGWDESCPEERTFDQRLEAFEGRMCKQESLLLISLLFILRRF